MDSEDVKAYLQRDWAAIQRSKDQAWLDITSKLGPLELLDYAGDLADHVRAMRPEWPTAEDRAEDLATHIRVSRALRSV